LGYVRRMRRALLAGLGFSLVALVPLGVLFAWTRGVNDDKFVYLAPAALVSAFALGTFFWSLLVSRASALRGGLAGFLTGTVSHLTTWYLVILALWITGAKSSLGEKTLGPVDGLAGALVFGGMSLLLLGWLTAPLAALAGVVFARVPALVPKASGSRRNAVRDAG